MNNFDNPTVTIAIATYNRAETLRCAIESVLKQTYQNFELWVVGDCCTDHTEEVVNEFMQKDNRIKFYNLPQNSRYQSRPNNHAIKNAKGKYIAYLNHDDLWLPNHLQDTIEHIEKTDADFVFSIVEWVYSFTYSKPDIPLLPDMPIPPEATAVVHKKDVVDVIGYWKDIHETKCYPRVDFFRQAQKAKMKFEMVPSMTALKFLWDEKNYAEVGVQPEFMKRIANEPDFINKEMSQMLIKAYNDLEIFPSRKRIKKMLLNKVRKTAMKYNIDPASLKFWNKKGEQIKIWRKRHKLEA